MIDYKLLAEEKANNKKEIPDDLDFTEFLAACYYLLNPQSYGFKIEDRVKNDFNFIKLKQKLGIGDYKVGNDTNFEYYNFELGARIEFKISYLSKDHCWNLLQLRSYENFDYYVFLLINPYDGCKHEWFVIEKNDFENVFDGLSGCHGTKESNIENKNIEERLTIPYESNVYYKLKTINKITHV